jgi:flagellar protein FliT
VDGEQIINLYEAVLSLTRQMLDAARSSRWEDLIASEDERSRLIDHISKNDTAAILDSRLREIKRDLIGSIMQHDAEIRILTQDWMRELRVVISSLSAQQKLQHTYGDPGLSN